MRVSPVSFKSLFLCYSPNFDHGNNKPRLAIDTALNVAFEKNKAINNFRLQPTEEHTRAAINANAEDCWVNFGKYLDKKYREENPDYSNKVKLTKAWAYKKPKEFFPVYFVTASNKDDEKKIHDVLSKHHEFYTVRFREKPETSDDGYNFVPFFV